MQGIRRSDPHRTQYLRPDVPRLQPIIPFACFRKKAEGESFWRLSKLRGSGTLRASRMKCVTGAWESTNFEYRLKSLYFKILDSIRGQFQSPLSPIPSNTTAIASSDLIFLWQWFSGISDGETITECAKLWSDHRVIFPSGTGTEFVRVRD